MSPGPLAGGPGRRPSPGYGPGDVSVVGLGAMGAPMARVLAGAGLRPVVWNRTRAKADALADADVTIADTPAGAATRLVLTVLDDAHSVDAVLDGPDGVVAGWRSAGIERPMVVVMGTVSPGAMRALAARLDGVRVVDAPVSGGPQGAAEATMSIMVGASPEDYEEIAPVLAVLGGTVRRMGELGAGQVAKTCNQVIVASTMAAVSEAFALGREAGLDREALLDILRGGLAASRILDLRGRNWVDERFEPGGRAALHLKDFRAAREIADAAGLSLTVTPAVEDLFRGLVDAGDGDLDHSAVFVEAVRRRRAH